jgi:hypothetical protein
MSQQELVLEAARGKKVEHRRRARWRSGMKWFLLEVCKRTDQKVQSRVQRKWRDMKAEWRGEGRKNLRKVALHTRQGVHHQPPGAAVAGEDSEAG